MTNQTGFFDFEAGMGLRKDVRHMLKTYETNGISWFETKGWFTSLFHVSGEAELVKGLWERIGNLEKIMDE